MKNKFRTLSFCKNTAALRWLQMTVLAFMLAACSGQKQRSIVIIYENDVHCNIDAYTSLKGLADAVADTAWVGIVSSGDFLHGGTAGAISEGEYIVDIMKGVEYTAVGLGNHEFDFGVPHLMALMDKSKLPVVNVNLRSLRDSAFFQPYIIKEYDGTKVAFVGVVTPETLISEAYAFYDKQGKQMYSLCEGHIVAEVQRAVNKARRDGADYVILLSHLGETSPKNFLTSHRLVSNTRGIDVVLDGHTHSNIPSEVVRNAEGKPVVITQTGSKCQWIGKLCISPNGGISTELIPTDSIKVKNSRICQITDSIKVRMSQITSKTVCHSNYPMEIIDSNGRQLVRTQETSIGNLVTDAFRAVTGTQLAVNNGGGIRSRLPIGEWTYGNIIDALPYNNHLMVVNITGAKLIELLVATTANTPMEDGQFPQISGFRFTLIQNAVGKERITNVEVLNDKTGRYAPLNPNATYTLCTTDYCVSGGGMYNVLKNADVTRETSTLYNQSLTQYVTEHLNGEIPERYASVENRITIK